MLPVSNYGALSHAVFSAKCLITRWRSHSLKTLFSWRQASVCTDLGIQCVEARSVVGFVDWERKFSTLVHIDEERRNRLDHQRKRNLSAALVRSQSRIFGQRVSASK